MSRTNDRRTCVGTLILEYYSDSGYGPTKEIKIEFNSLRELLNRFERFYVNCNPLTYKILRYCSTWSYYSPGAINWYFQLSNVAEQPKEEGGYEVNKEYISGLYFILEQHLFDKGLR